MRFATTITYRSILSIMCVLIGLSMLAASAIAQTNPTINYQGKLTTSAGVAVPNGTYNMRFWLLTTPSIATSSALWSESLTTTNRVQVTNGLFSVMLGSTTPLTSVNFNQTLYLAVEIGGTSTSPVWDGEMSPRKVIGTVPAAFEARRLEGLSSSSLLRSDEADTLAATTSGTLLSVIQNGAGAIARFFSGVTEVFTIGGNGNVGVGTSTPSQAFTVAGNTRITGAFFDGSNASGTSGMVLQTTGTTTRWVATSSLGFGSSNVTAIDDLTDVTITTPGSGQLLSFNGSAWVNRATATLGIALSDTTGTLAATRGGTGLSSITQNQLLIGGAGDTWSQVATSSLGLIGGGGATNRVAYFSSAANLTSDSTFTYSSSRLSAPILEMTGLTGTSTIAMFSDQPFIKASSTRDNTFIGLGAGGTSTVASGFDNQYGTAVGAYAMQRQHNGQANSAFGAYSLQLNTSGSSNAAFGAFSLSTNVGGSNNSVFGNTAMRYGAVGSNNSAFGYAAGQYVVGSDNVMLGTAALSNGSATGTVAVGMNAGNGSFGQSSTYNTFIGTQAGYSVSTGSTNTTLGAWSGRALTTGSNNIFLGASSSANVTTGSNNIALGYNINLASSTGSNQLNIGNLLFGTGIDGTGTTISSGNIGIGTSSPTSRFALERTGVSGTTTALFDYYLGLANASGGAVQYGGLTNIVTTNTATTSIVGNLLRITDSTSYGNTVRGLEVQTNRGTNTLGENTAISGFGRTFGIRGTTEGDAGSVLEPAGVYGVTRGTTQGNAIRGYSSSITTASLLSLFQDTSAFAGTGLLMNFGNTSGSFSSSSSKFLDLQVAGVSRFTVNASGTLTIGDGVNDAGLVVRGSATTTDLRLTGALRDSANSAGTSGMVLQSTGTSTRWVSTSTLAISGGSGVSTFLDLTDTDMSSFTANRLIFTNGGGTGLTDASSLTYDGTILRAASLWSNGSSTIGGGAQNTGLTINGGATTTGNSYIGGALTVVGNVTMNAGVGTGGTSGFSCSTTNAICTFGGQNGVSGVTSLQGYTAQLVSGASVVALTAAGNSNIGIGSTSPSAKLTVHALNGDTNTALFTIASSTANSTSTLFTVLAGGNVGIGTTSPLARFSIDTSLLGATPALMIGSSTGRTSLMVANNGFVGIGTKNPQKLFHFTESGFDNNAFFENLTSHSGISIKAAAGFAPYIAFDSDGNGTGFFGLKGSGSDPATSDLGYYFNTDGGINSASSMVLNTVSDNLGLGTSTPQNRFTVIGANNYPLLDLASSTGQSLLRVTADGFLGLGTTSPSARLTIAGDLRVTGRFADSASSTGSLGQILSATANGTAWVSTSTLGLGNGTFVGLSDTDMSSLTANRLIFTNSGGTGLTDSASLTFNGGTLGVTGSTTASLGYYIGTDTAVVGSTTRNTFFFAGAISNSFTSGANYNYAIGRDALTNLSTGDYNFAVGQGALQGSSTALMSGSNNISLGLWSLFSNSSGSNNNAIGNQTLYNNTTGSYNNAFNEFSLSSNTTGSYNNALGTSALGANTTGSFNTALSARSLLLNNGTGSIAIGYQAADNALSVDRSIFIGYDIDAFSTTQDNVLNIGNLLFGTGLDGTGTTLSSGNVGIGTSSPSAKLTVSGDMRLTGRFADSSSSTGAVGSVLTSTANGTAWVATSSLGLGGGSSNWLDNGAFLTPLTPGDGLVLTGSSTAMTLRISALRDSTNSLGTIGQILQSNGATSQWISTSTLGLIGGLGATNRVAYFSDAANLTSNSAFTFDGTTLTANQINVASSTLGYQLNGTTVINGSTTLNNYLFAGATSTRVINGIYNLGFGLGALYNASGSASNNLAMGQNALFGSTTGMTASNNIALGQNVLSVNSSGQNNIGIGVGALQVNQSGSFNVGVGVGALTFNTIGEFNSAFGQSSLYDNTTGQSNVAVGSNSLQANTVGFSNIGVGRSALGANLSGFFNTGIGEGALYNNRNGTGTVAIGHESGYGGAFNSSSYNSFLGFRSGFSIRTGSQNTALGSGAGYLLTTGANNIFLGASSSANVTTGSNNIALGYNINLASSTGSNQLNIGNLLFGTGVDGTGTTLSTGNIGIGTTSPSAKLTIAGDMRLTGHFADSSSSTGAVGSVLTATANGTQWLSTSTLGLSAAFSNSAGLAALLSDETGTGLSVFGTGAVLSSTTLSGVSYFSGDVGIGSTTPAGRLSIGTDALGSSPAFIVGSSSNNRVGMIVNNDLSVGLLSRSTSADVNIGWGSQRSGWAPSVKFYADMDHQMVQSISNNDTYLQITTIGEGGGYYIGGAELSGVTTANNTPGLLLNGYQQNSGLVTVPTVMVTGRKWNGASSGTVLTGSDAIFGISSSTNYIPDIAVFRRDGSVGFGSTTPGARLTLRTEGSTGTTTEAIGIDQYMGLANVSAGAVQIGNRFNLVTTNTATTTIVGSIFRIQDSTTFGNTLRGLEVQAQRGTNTLGENTAISGFARTFGVRGTTEGDAGAIFEPAGVYGETRGTTQGNAIRGYSSTITTAALLSLFQDTSAFTGTGLAMNFGNAGGTFNATSSRFLDFRVSGTSRFTVNASGTLAIGDGTNKADLTIGRGSICVDDDGTCIASTTAGVISADTYFTGNSDLAENYFSNDGLRSGEIVSLAGGLSVDRANSENRAAILGVVSTAPGLTLGADDSSLRAGEAPYPIALSGRVPIRLSSENGPIKKGDQITLSSIPGVGMKATSTGIVVGVALEDFDEDKAYSETFINQFGENLITLEYPPFIPDDPRINDGCYFGGGAAAGEAPCVPLLATTTDGQAREAEMLAAQEAKERALRQLARTPSATETLEDGRQVKVGQITMFVDRSYRYLTTEQEATLATLMSTSTEAYEVTTDTPTLFDRMAMLASSFMDGVLSIFRLETEEVQTEQLCIGTTCVDEATLKQLLEAQGQPPDPAVVPDSGSSGEPDAPPDTSQPGAEPELDGGVVTEEPVVTEQPEAPEGESPEPVAEESVEEPAAAPEPLPEAESEPANPETP